MTLLPIVVPIDRYAYFDLREILRRMIAPTGRRRRVRPFIAFEMVRELEP
jgi:hypothetical protein